MRENAQARPVARHVSKSHGHNTLRSMLPRSREAYKATTIASCRGWTISPCHAKLCDYLNDRNKFRRS